ncbi:MAG: hypothetical protein KJZ85_10245 [Rhodobacteraceae bacterium]|jgi:hypothetical protein|nr:hypothetical protein [Paracoccaceae bacterium]
MFGTTRLDRHGALMTRLAGAVGADLAHAVSDGRLGAPDLRTALLGCTACANAGACEDWLDEHPRGAGAAPGFCRNRELLERLAGR